MTERADPENSAKLSPGEQYEQNPWLASEISQRRWRQYRDAHPIPPEVRDEVLKRAGSRCESCGERRPLELHHVSYETPFDGQHGGDPIFGQEKPEDLRALCRGCHHDIHRDPAGNYWMDVNEKDVCWETYDRELELG